MSLLRALIVKNSHILAGIYFAFLKIRHGLNFKRFQYQTWTGKSRESSYQIRQILALFCKLIALKLN